MRFVELLAVATVLVAATATAVARGEVSSGIAAQGPGGVAHKSSGGSTDVLFSKSDPVGGTRDDRIVPAHEELDREPPLRDASPAGAYGQRRATAGRPDANRGVLRTSPAPPRLALESRGGQASARERTKTSSWSGWNGNGSISTMLGGLAIALGVFLLFAWAMRKRMPKGSARLPDEIIEVLGRTTLAAKQSLHLVRVGGKLIVVSVTVNGTETLTEITDPSEVTRILAACQQHSIHSSTAAFRQVFDQFGRERASGFLDGQPRRTQFTGEGTRAV